jgi:hypothetical protein
MTAPAIKLSRTQLGWSVSFSDGRELAHFRGPRRSATRSDSLSTSCREEFLGRTTALARRGRADPQIGKIRRHR